MSGFAYARAPLYQNVQSQQQPSNNSSSPPQQTLPPLIRIEPRPEDTRLGRYVPSAINTIGLVTAAMGVTDVAYAAFNKGRLPGTSSIRQVGQVSVPMGDQIIKSTVSLIDHNGLTYKDLGFSGTVGRAVGHALGAASFVIFPLSLIMLFMKSGEDVVKERYERQTGTSLAKVSGADVYMPIQAPVKTIY